MSTWISELGRLAKLVLVFVLVLPLSACIGTPGGAPASRNVVTEVPLYGGGVVVRGPRGYCVDADNLRRGTASNLVFLASCESLTGEPGVSVEPALMVISVLPRRADASAPTAEGIARSMAPKRPIEMFDRDGVAVVHLDAGGAQVLPGGDPRYWRGGMVVNGHLVGMAVYGRARSSIAGDRGGALILELARSIRAATPVRLYRDEPRAVSGAAPAQGEVEPDEGTAQGLGAIFGGLFRNPS